jgi:hypothetical protein
MTSLPPDGYNNVAECFDRGDPSTKPSIYGGHHDITKE